MNIQNKKNRLIYLLSILETIIFLILTILIPSDQKNSVFLGLSRSRWLLIGLHVGILIIMSGGFLYFKQINKFSNKVLERKQSQFFLEMFLLLVGFLLWVLIWLPVERAFPYTPYFVRLRPLLLNIVLLGFQFALLLLSGKYLHLSFSKMKLNSKHLKRSWIFLIILAGMFGIVLLLSRVTIPVGENEYYISAGTPISPLQLCVGLFSFFLFWRLEHVLEIPEIWRKRISGIIFALIWLAAIIIWSSITLPCDADRIGPFAPNYVCYPEINDAAFSVGSQYIGLGEGIYNHWPYDKPFYLTFIAIGQSLFGSRIDHYIFFQIILIGLLPALLFLIGKKLSNFSGGLFLATMLINIEANSIVYYSQFDTVNVKLENSEQLTGLLLFLAFLILYTWFERGKNLYLLFFAGGLLGASSLTRMNAFFVFPFIVLLIILIDRKDFKLMFCRVLFLSLGFLIVFSPWLFMAKTPQGRNLYIVKIQQVMDTRYASENDASANGASESDVSEIDVIENEISDSDDAENGKDDMVSSQLGGIAGNLLGVIAHFSNNQILSLAKLPVAFQLVELKDIARSPLYSYADNVPIWKRPVNLGSWLHILLNLLIVCLGVFFVWKRFGVSGLLPALIQAAYHIGNGFAQTSGGRYLIPVFWVTLLYFGIGLFIIVLTLIKYVLNIEIVSLPRSENILSKQDLNYPVWKKAGVVLVVILLACAVPFTELIPSFLPQEINQNARDQVADLFQNSEIDIEDEQFKSLISEGAAFHPMVYQPVNYKSGRDVLELLVLGDEHFYAVYVPGFVSIREFSDRSRVIVAGCPFDYDRKWGAERIIMEAGLIMQLDHEMQMYFDPDYDFSCEGFESEDHNESD